jgi:endonuclease/exonuclease/phosphatase family metal-dependent hydrolase
MVLIAALVVAVCAVVSGSRLLGVPRSPVPQLAAFAPWTILGWTLALVLLVSARWWWIALVVLVLLLVQVSWVLPTPAARAAAGPRPGTIPLRVMTINVYAGQADVVELVRIARDEQVDLLAVEETVPDLVQRLTTGLGDLLPYVVQSDPEAASGTVVWSRWPIAALEPALGEGHQISRMLLQVPGATPVTVTGVHTMSPGRGRLAGWTRDLEVLTQASERSPGAQVMLGDFNASVDHQAFRLILATGLVDAAEAMRVPPWRSATWPADKRWFPVAVRLDHVLVTPASVGVRAVRRVRVSGTDHLGVRADLVLDRAE